MKSQRLRVLAVMPEDEEVLTVEGARIGGALVAAPALVVDLQLAAAAAADRDPLQQRLALADRAARLVRARARVAGDPRLVALERLAVDEAGVVVPDQRTRG